MTSRPSPWGQLGLHLPQKIYENQGLSQKVCLIIKTITIALLRLIYFIVSNIFAATFYFTLIALLEPVRHFAETLYWYCVGWIFKWLQLIVGFWMWSGGYKVEVCGDDISDIEDEETLVLVNHQSSADVPALMYAFQFNRRILRNVLWVMDMMFKRTDFGWVSAHRGDFFIRQGKETRHLQEGLLSEHLLNIYLPRGREWIVVFPEGGFLWKQKKSSQAYGKKNGFPHLENCLLPRAGAVHTVLETLNAKESGARGQGRNIKWILDVTVAYPSGKPLNLQTIMFGQRDPMNVTLHYNKINISQVPVGSLDGLRDWMFDVYKEKDKKLDLFHRTGRFPSPSVKKENYRETPVVLNFSVSTMAAMNAAFTLVTCFAAYTLWSILGPIINLFW